MAKKLGDATNPISSGTWNVLSPTEWFSRIVFVGSLGVIFVLASKLVSVVDKFVPGNYTPTQMQNSTGTIMSAGPITF